MFFQDNTGGANTGPFGTPGGDGSFVNRAGQAALNAVKPSEFIEGLKTVENQAKQVARTVFGQVGEASRSIQKSLVESFKSTVDIGATLEDNVKIYSSISTALQRNAYLTNEQLESLVTLQRTTNLTAEEIGSMVTGFQDLGQGTDAAIEKTTKLAGVARSYGLNVSQFLKTTGDNLKLVNAYGFQNGVEGLGRMVARAQSLRMDFTKITGLAADLLSPEKAIDLAAEMQILGGAVGDLADPFKLMYMAENDMEGLQNAIIDTAKSAVMFNEDTGEFKITGVEMRRLRAQADALNMSYEDLANTAVKAAKEQKVMESLDFTGLDKDTKQLVSNLAEIGPDGQISLNLPDLKKPITDLSVLQDKSSEEYKALTKTQENSKLSERQIAEKQLSLLEKQNATLLKIQTSGVLAGDYVSGQPGSRGEDLESLMRAVVEATGEQTTSTIEGFVQQSQFTKTVTDFVTGSNTLGDSLKTTIEKFSEEMSKLMTNLPGSISDALVDIDPEVPEGATTVTEEMNQFSDGLSTLTISMDSLTSKITEILSTIATGNVAEMSDGFFPAGSAEIISGPEGSFRLHPEDMVFVGTDPYGTKNSYSGNQNINFTNPMEIRLQVDGVNNDDFKRMMESPEWIAAVRKTVQAGIGSALGNTTAGYV
jgi:hypothetical protein